MVGLDLIDINDYRVRFAKDLTGRHTIVLCHVKELDEVENGWQPITEASDIDCDWSPKFGAVFAGKFAEKNPFNIPGPIYGAMTDTCATGPAEAPDNVMLDPAGQEFIFRQPSNVGELRQVFGAAWIDPFVGYGVDGNSNWSLELIRDWWRSRMELIHKSQSIPQPKKQVARWRSYLDEQAESYLRAYAFLIEDGHLPSANDVLPDVR